MQFRDLVHQGPLSKTPLGQFVYEIATKFGTLKHYTNHGVTVSTNIITNSGKFNDKDVMDFTGHKVRVSRYTEELVRNNRCKYLQNSIRLSTKDQIEENLELSLRLIQMLRLPWLYLNQIGMTTHQILI